MNKKFFTLMAAILVGGAAMPSDAFAQKVDFSSLAQTDSMIALSDGVRFMMGSIIASDTTAWSVADSSSYVVLDAQSGEVWNNTTTCSVFEVKNFNKSTHTFELWVNGKQFVHTDADKNTYPLFYAVSDNANNLADSTNIVSINTFAIGAPGLDAFQGSKAVPLTSKIKHDASSLNAYLNQGVKFGFPEATNLESNPLGEHLIAISTNTLNHLAAFEGCTSQDSVVFVLKDANYKTPIDKDNFAKMSVAVVDSFSTYGITGMTDMEGHPISFVKGDKLGLAADKAKGIHAQDAARFVLAENDNLNATGAVTIDATISGIPYRIGAYSLTAGGLKSYVTAVKTDKALSKAVIGAGKYAETAALLNANGKAVYNLYFTDATRPADAGTEASYYGKYLVNDAAENDTAVVAPAKVNLKIADAQWIVKAINTNGRVTFTNARTLDQDIDMTLYATDEPGLFTMAGKMGDVGQVKLVPVTEDETYVTFTDDQLKQNVEFVFNGTDDIAVSQIYMKYDSDNKRFSATQNENSSIKNFRLSKSNKVKKGYTYAYTNGSAVLSKSDTLEVQSYQIKLSIKEKGTTDTMVDKLLGFVDVSKLDTVPSGKTAMNVVFKNTADGHLHMLAFHGLNPGEVNGLTGVGATFKDSIAESATAQLLYVKASDATIDSTVVLGEKSYCNVTYTFAGEKGTSYPSVCTHANFVGSDGSISWKENEKTGLLEGVLSLEPLVFWLDTANSDEKTPAFYISKAAKDDEDAMRAVATEPDRQMLFNPANYLKSWNEETAKWDERPNLKLSNGETKAIFAQAAITGVNKLIWYNEESEVANVPAADVDAFKFNITEKDAGYVITSVLDNLYLYSLNGKLGFTDDTEKALVVEVEKTTVTANDAIEAAGVQVIGGQGVVTVQGAAGKVVTVANILGQTIANQVAASDNVTIAAPAGVVVVTVDGEATKVVVK